MKARSFEFVSSVSVSDITHRIEAWLRDEKNMEVAVFHLDEGRYALQARCRRSESARMFGLDRAVCLQLTPLSKGRIMAVIGGSRWKDKALAASVSLVTLWPLMLTAIAGAAGQIALAVRLRKRIIMYAREVKI